MVCNHLTTSVWNHLNNPKWNGWNESRHLWSTARAATTAPAPRTELVCLQKRHGTNGDFSSYGHQLSSNHGEHEVKKTLNCWIWVLHGFTLLNCFGMWNIVNSLSKMEICRWNQRTRKICNQITSGLKDICPLHNWIWTLWACQCRSVIGVQHCEKP